MKSIGGRAQRVDAFAKVTGMARYSSDFIIDDMLYIRALRAPVPHARIKRIDTLEAERMEGVERVISAKDIPWVKNFGLIQKDQEVLVREKARYLGDPIALVAARNERIARRALRKIRIEYEELEVVDSAEKAMEEGAPLVHENGNIVATHYLEKGDISKGFAEAEYIEENEFTTSHIDHVPLEPEAGVGLYNPETGVYTLWSSSQWIHKTQGDIAQSLGVAPEKINIVLPAIGGAFGRREDISVQLHLAIMAKLTGKPVKMVLNREESMLSQGKRHPMKLRVKTGYRGDGTITAWEEEIIGDTGAYASAGSTVLQKALYHCTGPYRVENVKGTAYTVYTNNTYAGAMRGFGVTQASFAHERQIDIIAGKLGIDPMEMRMRNAYDRGDTTPTGEILDESVGMKESLKKASEAFSRQSTRIKKNSSGKKRGVGVGSIFFACGYGKGLPDHSSLSIEVTDNSKLIVKTSIAELGQGALTVINQIISEILGFSPENILFDSFTTEGKKSAGPTSSSRQTIFSGNAAKYAAEKLLAKLYHHTYMETGEEITHIESRNGRVYWNKGSKSMSLGELKQIVERKGDSLASEASSFIATDRPDPRTGQAEHPFCAYSYNTHIVEVEVDVDTGAVEIVRVVAAPDVGKVINLDGVEGQSEGGTAMGIGMALYEKQILRGGYTLNADLSTYTIPTALDVPDIETAIVESGKAVGPFGAKGIGEPAMVSVIPAIANAVSNALCGEIYSLPVDRETIWRLLEEA